MIELTTIIQSEEGRERERERGRERESKKDQKKRENKIIEKIKINHLYSRHLT